MLHFAHHNPHRYYYQGFRESLRQLFDVTDVAGDVFGHVTEVTSTVVNQTIPSRLRKKTNSSSSDDRQPLLMVGGGGGDDTNADGQQPGGASINTGPVSYGGMEASGGSGGEAPC